MAVSQTALADRFAELQGARATWLVPAAHTVDVIAKIGLLGPEDRLVAFADDCADSFEAKFPGKDVQLIADPAPDAFLLAGNTD